MDEITALKDLVLRIARSGALNNLPIYERDRILDMARQINNGILDQIVLEMNTITTTHKG